MKYCNFDLYLSRRFVQHGTCAATSKAMRGKAIKAMHVVATLFVFSLNIKKKRAAFSFSSRSHCSSSRHLRWTSNLLAGFCCDCRCWNSLFVDNPLLDVPQRNNTIATSFTCGHECLVVPQGMVLVRRIEPLQS